jgi:hypothetical protein
MWSKLLKFNIFAFKNLCGMLTVNRFEIPHYTYT